MVAPVNEFDKILQAEASRTLAARGGIILSTTANTVLVDGAGAGTPSIITLKATPMVVAGSVTWSTSPTVPLTLDSTGLIATLHFSDMGTGSVAVTVTLESNGITYTDERTVSQVRIGSLGYAGALDATRNNTAQGPLASRPAGGDGDFYFATDALVLYQKVSGTWQPAGNNFTNTSQMIDGANLGGTATWGGVSGSGKPQDNATVGANASNFTGTLGGDNLMNNSGFEVQTTADTNRPNGYQAYNNAGIAAAYVAVTGRLGGKAYGLKALATGASTFGLASGAYTVETDGTSGGVSGGWQPNTTYIVSFKARKVNGANMTGVALQWNTSPLTTAWVSRPALSTSWQTYTARITLGASVEGNGQLLIDGNGGVGSSVAINDEFHVDELIVQEGDVPSEWFPSPRDAATAIAVITNDNMLSKAEKPQVMIDVAAISDEKPGLVTQCGDLGVDSGPYQTAYNALSAYLASLSPAWNDTTQDTVIDGAAFRTKFTDYYSAKQSLINALASKASTMASGVTLTAGGALQGTGGTGGQVTNLPVIDTRSVNNPPSDYGICHIKEFKDQSVIGIPGASASTFCVLETLKGWNDASGGQALQWAHISSGVVYKRSAANDATSWGAWVRDLDTDIYTGDLDATHGAQAGANLFDASGNVISQTAILNSGVSISAAGALSGAGGGQVTLPGMGHNTYRVITVGNSFSGTLPASVGLYINGVLQSGTNIARSYSVIVFNRSNGNIVSATNYDVYGVGQVGGLTAADMAAALNALATDKIVLVVSYDEPHDHRLDSGLDTAMYRCGASRAVYGSPNFKIRSAYVLVGIPGCGEGNGAEAYQGSIDSDPNAWVDTGFSIVNGVLTGVSVNYRPLTLADFNYTGDLNATVGATLGTNVDGQITSANSSTLVGAQAIQSVHISDLRTTNYAEDSGGNPTAGAKMASSGTAMKVASNSFQVGTLVLSDYWFRLVQGADGNVSTGRVIWRGNNDATTRGGAPDISRLSMVHKMSIVKYDSTDSTQTNVAGYPGSGSGVHTVFYGYSLTPTSYSGNTDNLDAMQQIHVQFFAKANDTSPFIEMYQACPSRTYDGATGAVYGTLSISFMFNGHALWYSPPPAAANPNLSGSAPNILQGSCGGTASMGVYAGYLRVRVANTYGWSATADFAPTASTSGTPTIGTTYTNNIASPSGTITGVAGSSGGGSGSQGGACPAPWVKVRLLSGRDVSASDLHNGAVLAGVNDSTMEALPKGGVVRDLATIWAQRYRVKLTDGSVTEWSENHRFATVGRGWVEVQNLRGGDQIMGLRECVVESVLAMGKGQVVSFRVEGSGTYFAGGMLCHNTKTNYL